MSNIVAVEVASDSIRAAEVKGYNSKSPKLLKLAEMELHPEIAGESEVYNIDELASAFKDFWSKEKFSTKNIAIAVGGRRFTIRPHETGHTSLDTLKNLLKFEAVGAIPEQMSNPVYDFYPTSSSDSKSGVRTSGLVIATPSEPIEMLINCILRAGLKVLHVDFASMSVARYISKAYGDELNYGLINIRENNTDILLAKNGIPQTIRVAPKGLDPVRKRPGKHAIEESEITSFSGSSTDESPIQALVREVISTTSIQKDDFNASLEKLFISGPRSLDDELIDLLRKSFDCEIISLTAESPQAGLELNEDKEDYRASEFVAMCAGMRGKK